MINVREFRVGNYVNTKYGNLKVFTINEDGLEIEDSSGFVEYFKKENLEPIEITEEILLKCGFEEKNSILEKDGIRLFKIRDLYFRGNFPIKADVRYLHQLQNLYWCLTNEELKINI